MYSQLIHISFYHYSHVDVLLLLLLLFLVLFLCGVDLMCVCVFVHECVILLLRSSIVGNLIEQKLIKSVIISQPFQTHFNLQPHASPPSIHPINPTAHSKTQSTHARQLHTPNLHIYANAILLPGYLNFRVIQFSRKWFRQKFHSRLLLAVQNKRCTILSILVSTAQCSTISNMLA